MREGEAPRTITSSGGVYAGAIFGRTKYIRADLVDGLVDALREVKAAQAAGELSYRTSAGRGYEAMLAVDAVLARALTEDHADI